MTNSTKYNRGKLKKQFFTSKYENVKDFFESAQSGYNNWIQTKTKGWREEKKKMSQKSFEKAKEEIIEETKEEIKEYYKPSIKELSDMHKTVMNLLKGELQIMIDNAREKKENSMNKMNNIREIVKVEKGEPTSTNRIEQEINSNQPIEIIVDSSVKDLMDKIKKRGK